MSLEEMLKDVPRTRIEFADGLEKSRLAAVRSALRSVTVTLSRLRRPNKCERPLRQSDIDDRYTDNVGAYERKITKRLYGGASSPPAMFVADKKIIITERRDRR
ncbi:MAG TPA: hypothetical protein VK421_06200 [Pyrinomonadaceae bacterium]|nr:hypothetical protein [Pyrinomonadaceae bacterium]